MGIGGGEFRVGPEFLLFSKGEFIISNGEKKGEFDCFRNLSRHVLIKEYASFRRKDREI